MIFVFKTSVSDNPAIKNLQPLLDNYLPNSKWNFDLEDCDNILRIESQIVVTGTIINLLKDNGYDCDELPD
jgi:hypothetical protein